MPFRGPRAPVGHFGSDESPIANYRHATNLTPALQKLTCTSQLMRSSAVAQSVNLQVLQSRKDRGPMKSPGSGIEPDTRDLPSSDPRPVHGEFVIKGPRSSDPDPLLLSPMRGKLLVHEKCYFSDGASAGQTGRSPGNWRDPSRSR